MTAGVMQPTTDTRQKLITFLNCLTRINPTVGLILAQKVSQEQTPSALPAIILELLQWDIPE
jgi:hypothetical protein